MTIITTLNVTNVMMTEGPAPKFSDALFSHPYYPMPYYPMPCVPSAPLAPS